MRFSPEVVEKARRLYLRGWSAREVAKKLGIPPRTVQYWAKKYGWRGEREAVLAVDAAAKSLAEDVEPKNLAGKVLRRWVEKGKATDRLLGKLEELVERLEKGAETSKELGRAVWALREAVDALVAARAEERQLLKLILDAKLALEGERKVEFVVRVEGGDENHLSR